MVALLCISENTYMKITGLMARQPSSGLWGPSIASICPAFATLIFLSSGGFYVSMPQDKGQTLLNILS